MSKKFDKRSSSEYLAAIFNKLKLTFYIITLGIVFMFMFVSHLLKYSTNVYKMSKLIAVDFEVFGKVQGVSFRMCTQITSRELGVKGWCRNTNKGTVVGQLEGPSKNVEEMKRWLQETGSPKSIIEKAVFTNEKEISSLSFNNFDIRK